MNGGDTTLQLPAMHPICFSPARLRARRDQRGLTRSELAERCGLSVAAIKDYESGRHTPGADALGRLAAQLACQVDDFFVRTYAELSDAS